MFFHRDLVLFATVLGRGILQSLHHWAIVGETTQFQMTCPGIIIHPVGHTLGQVFLIGLVQDGIGAKDPPSLRCLLLGELEGKEGNYITGQSI